MPKTILALTVLYMVLVAASVIVGLIVRDRLIRDARQESPYSNVSDVAFQRPLLGVYVTYRGRFYSVLRGEMKAKTRLGKWLIALSVLFCFAWASILPVAVWALAH